MGFTVAQIEGGATTLRGSLIGALAADGLASAHQSELPQKDELCGPFWGKLALVAAGFPLITQDDVALRAGTYLSESPSPTDIAPRANSRRDYEVVLPRLPDPELTGTSASGLARAIEDLSDQAVAVVGVQSPIDATIFSAVFDLAAAAGPSASLIANLATRYLWGAQPDPAAVIAYLVTGADLGPPADWDVGHFVGLWGQVHGPGGTGVLVADTYSSRGWHGLHLQPLPRILSALDRDGSRRGGLLLVIPRDATTEAHEQLSSAGAQIGFWDNNSADAHELTRET